jgi:hypothetical protein
MCWLRDRAALAKPSAAASLADDLRFSIEALSFLSYLPVSEISLTIRKMRCVKSPPLF